MTAPTPYHVYAICAGSGRGRAWEPLPCRGNTMPLPTDCGGSQARSAPIDCTLSFWVEPQERAISGGALERSGVTVESVAARVVTGGQRLRPPR